jgi:acylphosphatase
VSSTAAKQFVVSGRVQGVGFRAFVRKHAKSLGLRGYAKNLANGDVEVVAAGAPGAIETLRGLLHRGPSWAEVRTVEEREAAAVGYDEFFIA